MTTFPYEWLARVQDLATVAIPIFLLWHYRRFAVPLVRFVTYYPGLLLVLAILYGMVYGKVGSGFGIPYLFWHDDFLPRAFSSTGATMLLAVVGVIAYYLDPYPWATDQRTAEFLRADEAIRHRLGRRYARAAVSGAADQPAGAPTRWGWLSYALFAANVLIDPIVVTPIQVWLEPRRDNSLRLERFLRAARNPFLILLIMPALLPSAWCFVQVPKAAPTGHLGTPLERLLGWAEPPILDVSRDLGGYVIGLASWLLGIWAGVLIVKVLILLGTVFHGARPHQGADRVPAGSGKELKGASNCHRVSAAFGGGLPEPSGSRMAPHPECPLAESDACPAAGCPRGEPDAPALAAPGCRARSELRASAAVFVALFFLTYAALGFVTHLRDIGWLGTPLDLPLFDLPPAFAICVVLAVLAMATAIIGYLSRPWQLPIVALLVAWLGFVNSDPFKYRFERISYKDPIPLRERVRKSYDVDDDESLKHRQGGSAVTAPSRDMVEDGDALTGWIDKARALGGKDLDSSKRPKLVIVAVSGGATRSAYWTAVVLQRLEDELRTELDTEFGQRVRMICGASGGMLGAASYVHYRRKVAEGDPPSDWIQEYLPTRSMDPLARNIALSEIWKAFWPGFVARDRGVILESDWKAIHYPIAELADREKKGEVPSLIFSPMIVEDGRRLLISNLQLGVSRRDNGEWIADSPLIESKGQQISPVSNPGRPSTATPRSSLSGLEYYRLF
jgi:hypothetical protein